MQGTEKQIKWAEDIKAQMTNDADRYIANMQAQAAKQKPEQLPMVDELKNRVAASIAEKIDAKWWIDNRSAQATELLVKPVWTTYIAELKGAK